MLPVGFGLPLHSQPLQREQQIVTRAKLCPQQARARPPSPATLSPLMSLQVAPREKPVYEAHLERAVAWSLQLHTGSGLAVPVTGHPGRAGGAGKAPGTGATAGPNGSPKRRRRDEGTGSAARYRGE